MILTVAEIKDLAECAGLALREDVTYDEFELETEIVVSECPEEGIMDDEGVRRHYASFAYYADYPEEGSYPLGNEIAQDAN